MDSFDYLDRFQNESMQKERTCRNIGIFNKVINNKNDIIMHVNIRSMNANFDRLKILIESLAIKPAIVICSETFEQVNCNLYQLKGSEYEYRIYYNESRINRNDGVIVFVNNNLVQNTEVIEAGRIKIINTRITLNDKSGFEISALYRSHGIPKTAFILDLNKYLIKKRNVKNHLVIGDFNIDLLDCDHCSQDFLCNFLDKGYIPGFVGITKPPIGRAKGSCIDNIFIKSHNIKTVTYKLKLDITDHYPIIIAVDKLKTVPKGPCFLEL